jgi:3'-5' exoribonuclease
MSEIVRNQPIASWQAGQTVEGFALLSRKERRRDRNGREYLDLELTDASGSMVGKVWADSPALNGNYEAHDFVAVKGTVKLYREQLQISLDSCRKAMDADRKYGFDEADLIPSTKEDIDELWNRLRSALDQVEDPLMARLARETLEAYEPELREHPAAKGIHHAYRGGLLEHVTKMAELALSVCSHYRRLDRDLVLLGVLFHDLGKIRELGAMPVNDYTLEGRLVGHVVLGRDLLKERVAAIPDFPEESLLHLEHLVLSHQGKREFASPVEPMTPEAFVLHALDDLDSKLNQLEPLRQDPAEMIWVRALGRYIHVPFEDRDDEPVEDPERSDPGVRTLFD